MAKSDAKTPASAAPTTAAKPVYALVGPDSFLQLQALADILASLPPDVQRIDADGERVELADVLDELRSFAMFGGGKVVVVRDADEFISRFRDSLETYLASPSSSSTLVLRCNSLPSQQRVHKLIQKTGHVVRCEPPKQAELPQWVMARAKTAHSLGLTPKAARLLAELIGDDLGRMDNELAKLALLPTADKGPLDVKDVEQCICFQREQQMWNMTDEIAAGHTTDALRRWRQLVQMDPSAEFRAVTWLGMWLEKVRKALAMRKQGADPFTIAKAVKIFPFDKAKPFVQTAERLGEDGAYRAMTLLVKIDHQTKTGIGDAAENVERFLLTVGGYLAQPTR